MPSGSATGAACSATPDGRWARLGEADGYRGREVFSLHEDQSGRLWVGNASGVFRRTDDSFELVDARSNNVQGFAEDDSGAMWVTDNAVILRRLGSPANAAFDPDIRLPTSSWKLLHDRRGHIWVAALGGGLLHLDDAGQPGAMVRRFDYERRMTGSTRSLYEDRDGNIWVGLRGGLLRLSEAVFRTGIPLDGLTQDGVRTMAVSGDGSVWVATSHSVNRFAGDQRTTYPLAPGAQSLQRSAGRDVGLHIRGAVAIQRTGSSAGSPCRAPSTGAACCP